MSDNPHDFKTYIMDSISAPMSNEERIDVISQLIFSIKDEEKSKLLASRLVELVNHAKEIEEKLRLIS